MRYLPQRWYDLQILFNDWSGTGWEIDAEWDMTIHRVHVTYIYGSLGYFEARWVVQSLPFHNISEAHGVAHHDVIQ